MGAGSSAREISQRTAVAAEVLQRKAEYAARKSASFALGADGEENVSAAIGPLLDQGWVVMPDRLSPAGGNLDFLLVGPPGVAIIDAKNWSYPVEVKDSRIFTGRYNRTKELDHLLEQVRMVEGALNELKHPVIVRGILALAGEPDRDRAEAVVRGIRTMGANIIAGQLTCVAPAMTGDQVTETAELLTHRFPSASSATQPMPTVDGDAEDPNPSQLFDRSHRFVYLKAWRKGGHNRLYLRSASGDQLGWKDVNSRQIEVTGVGDDARLAHSILEFATPIGVPIPSDALPKIPIDLPGGRMIGWVTKVRMTVCIGQEWQKGGGHRLYGTLVDPSVGTFPLGHVDLKSGRLVPSVEGKLSKDLGSAVKYLKLLADRRPIRLS